MVHVKYKMNKRISDFLKGFITGDMIGFQYEGLKSNRFAKNNNILNKKKIHHSTDDTEHLIFTKQSLQTFSSNGISPEIFKRNLKLGFLIWIFTFPLTIGMTTLKAAFKIIFFSKDPSVTSMGNGPVMRIPGIIEMFSNDRVTRNQYIKISTNLTHKSPKLDDNMNFIGDFLSFIYNNKNLPSIEQVLQMVNVNNLSQEKEYKLMLSVLQNEISINDFKKETNTVRQIVGYLPFTITFALMYNYKINTYEDLVDSIVTSGGDVDTNLFLASGIFLYIKPTPVDINIECFENLILVKNSSIQLFMAYLHRRVLDFVFIYTILFKRAFKFITFQKW